MKSLLTIACITPLGLVYPKWHAAHQTSSLWARPTGCDALIETTADTLLANRPPAHCSPEEPGHSCRAGRLWRDLQEGRPCFGGATKVQQRGSSQCDSKLGSVAATLFPATPQALGAWGIWATPGLRWHAGRPDWRHIVYLRPACCRLTDRNKDL